MPFLKNSPLTIHSIEVAVATSTAYGYFGISVSRKIQFKMLIEYFNNFLILKSILNFCVLFTGLEYMFIFIYALWILFIIYGRSLFGPRNLNDSGKVMNDFSLFFLCVKFFWNFWKRNVPFGMHISSGSSGIIQYNKWMKDLLIQWPLTNLFYVILLEHRKCFIWHFSKYETKFSVRWPQNSIRNNFYSVQK